jgi:metallo-beta-lactamase class B VIM
MVASALALGCFWHGAPRAARDALEIAPDLVLRELAPGVWLHTTWRDYQGARVPSNGLVIADRDGFLLVDSAWGDAETEALVEGIERELGGPIRLMLATHHHEDRLSGGEYLHRRGIRVVAHPLTVRLAAGEGGLPDPLPALEEAGSSTRLGPVEVFYPGPGHAADNVVAWVPKARILFGGCLVRPAESPSLGNTEDADLDHWADAVARVQTRYARARVVVPGHGPPAGHDALEHTCGLAEVVARSSER